MLETESCSHGYISRDYLYKGDMESLQKHFPSLMLVQTYNELTNPPEKGVYALVQDEQIIVRILGGCPNFNERVCDRGDDCIMKE